MTKLQPPPRHTGKKYIARAQREAEQQRKLLLGLGAVGLLVLFVTLVGVLRVYVIIPNRPVAIVEGTEISTADYRKRILYTQLLLDEQAAALSGQLDQLTQAFADNPELLQNLQNQTAQQLQQLALQRQELPRTVLDILIEEELVIQEAARRGITVPDKELNDAFNTQAAGRAGGFTASDAEATVTARAIAAADATATAALFTPTPTLTATESTTATLPTPVPTNPPLPTPTINVVSGDALNESISTWQDSVQETAKVAPEELRAVIYRQLLREKLVETIGAEAETTVLQANLRHIFVTAEEEAIAIRDRLEAGENFDDLVAELSLDPSTGATGGDLGWFSQDELNAISPEFGEIAFNQEIGQISDPVVSPSSQSSQPGWYLIEVLAREERELEGTALSQAQRNAYELWLSGVRMGNVEDLWTPDSPPQQWGQTN